MSFDNPRLLYFLFLLLPLILALFFRFQKRRKEVALFAALAPAEEQNAPMLKHRSRMIFSECFFVLFLGFCIIALAGPRWGEESAADYSRGVDLIFAFDLSRSMNVRDCPPLPQKTEPVSRLERALSLAHELSLGLEGMRLGAAIGKGRGVLALPLSYDTEAVFNFLSSINEFSLSGGGTNLESLIDAASGAFKDNMPGRRCIVLFSDGEELGGSLEAAASRAQSRGIVLCTAGIGSDQGGTVPLSDGTFLNSGGSPVISVRKAESLKVFAERSGGIYVDGNRSDAAAQAGTYLRSLSTESGLLGRRKESKSQSQVFVLAALASLGASRLAGYTVRNKKNSSAVKVEGALCMIFLSGLVPFLAGSCSRTEGKLFVMEGNYHQNRGSYTEAVSAYLNALDYPDAALYAEYGLGSAYFALEETQAALERYKSAEESLDRLPREQHPELRFRLKYNSGIIYFEQGNYEQAANAFRSALEIDGSKIEAKRNLELSLLSLVPVEAKGASFPDGGGEEKTGGEENADVPESSVSLVLFEYFRTKEQDQWKSREWAEETDFSGPDY